MTGNQREALHPAALLECLTPSGPLKWRYKTSGQEGQHA